MKKYFAWFVLMVGSALLGCAQDGRSLDPDKVRLVLGNVMDAGRTYTPAEEEAIGERVMADLLGAAPLVRNDALQRYVNQVGLWVALQSDKPYLKWRFGVTEDNDINSFAAPGGFILITKGLFNQLQSEAELAAVLGHEIIHVTQGHHVRAMKDSGKGEFLNNMARFGVEASSKKNAKYLGNAFTGGTEIFVRGFDKEDEYEADINGMVLAARAGYNPYALPGVLTTLGNINPSDNAVSLLFKTHPSPRDRLDKIDDYVGDKLERYANGVENTPTFQRMQR